MADLFSASQPSGYVEMRCGSQRSQLSKFEIIPTPTPDTTNIHLYCYKYINNIYKHTRIYLYVFNI